MTRPMALARELASSHALADQDLQFLLETQDADAIA